LASIEIDWRYPRPAWSPDGRTVAFLDTPGNVILVDVESGVQSEIGTDLATAGVALRVNDPPAWSPDGTLISFAYRYSGLEGQPAQKLCIVRVDETEATCMAEPIVYGDKPSWSPDGEYLLFFSRREGNYEIYTLEIETGLVTNLTHDPAYDGTPRWSPDGQRVVFASDRDGDLEIYMMDRSGENLVQLTDNHIDDDCPVWGP
jgi:Tol biopolymer transport system component